MGRITASFNDSFAASSPATSSHRTLGVSDKIAPDDRQFSVGLVPGRERGGGRKFNQLDRPSRNFLVSASVSSSPPFL